MCAVQVPRRGHGHSRPPRDPHAAEHQQHGVRHFYSASLPKSQAAGSRPKRSILGESPPSNSVGWLMGSTPPNGDGLFGSSPSSFVRR
jgi:hypothetical protein